MKSSLKLLITLLVVVVYPQAIFSEQGKPVKHSHKGRSHIHLLPKTGLNHNHNKGKSTTKRKRLRLTEKQKVYTNSIGMKFVDIHAGCFQMGRDANVEDGNDDELPQHKVCLDAFKMGETEVTQAQWVKIMGNNPSEFKGRTNPVEQVSWLDAQRFIKRLNQAEGTRKYSLPTEAQWEYAARAGTTTTYSFGDDKGGLGRYAWYYSNSGERSHPVAEKNPNKWGLYDMHGNIWEWVQDWYGEKAYRNTVKNNPTGPSSGLHRVVRGGGWTTAARYLRSAYRSNSSPDYRDDNDNVGFRLMRKP